MAPTGPIRTAGAEKKLIQVGRKSYIHSNFEPIGVPVSTIRGGKASAFWTGTAESRKTVTSMLTRKDDQ